jgi:hypothetical protein
MSAQAQPVIVAPDAALLLAPELELVLLEFRLRARRREAWLRNIWTAEADLLDADSPAAEMEWIAQSDDTQELNSEITAAEDALDSHRRSRLFILRDIFGLSPQEFHLLRACLAISLDPGLTRVCGMLRGDAARA